jgi:hypothetical protein
MVVAARLVRRVWSSPGHGSAHVAADRFGMLVSRIPPGAQDLAAARRTPFGFHFVMNGTRPELTPSRPPDDDPTASGPGVHDIDR